MKREEKMVWLENKTCLGGTNLSWTGDYGELPNRQHEAETKQSVSQQRFCLLKAIILT